VAAVGEAKFKFECPGRGLSRVRWGSRAGRRALGALASAGPGARGGGGRCAAPLPRAGCGARGGGAGALDARGAVAGQADGLSFSTDVAPPGGKNHPV